jgi:hypothetical protein
MAKNTLDTLNNHLFLTLENLTNPDIDESGNVINEMTPEKAKAVVAVSNQVIQGKRLQLEALKLVSSGDLGTEQSENIKQNYLTISDHE